jgi:GntR family transcriptional repressor for pyruvate dehydrogenase complex
MFDKKTNADILATLSLDKQSASERVAQIFLDKIKSGEIENSYCMPSQRKLAQMFGVGMSTIREALKILNVMGYVNAIHGKGTFVVNPPAVRDEVAGIRRALKLTSFSDLMIGRKTIECAIVELAAQNAKLNNLEEIRHSIDEMEINAGNAEAWFDAELMGFHSALAKASQNQTLLQISKALTQRIRHEYLPLLKNAPGGVSEENIQAAVKTAKEVYRFIKARDPKGASFALDEHMSIVLGRMYFEAKEELICD